MGKVLEEITQREIDFIAKQRVFFVATAPHAADTRVNVSPKAPAGASVVVLGPHKVAYLDLTGSGSETAAHVLQDDEDQGEQGGRITLLFCNLEEGPPKLMRLHGTATLLTKEEVPKDLLSKFPPYLTQNPGFRGIFVVAVNRISTSCGYTMPVMTFHKYRKTLDEYMDRLTEKEQQEYMLKKNSYSIDGLESISLKRFANKQVTPYAENGYIFGREGGAVAGDTVDDAATLARKIRAQSSKSLENSNGNHMAVAAAAIAGCIVGLFVGAWIASSYELPFLTQGEL